MPFEYRTPPHFSRAAVMEEPVILTGATRSWYELVFGANPGWERKKSKASLEQEGIRPSHLSMGGAQFAAGKMVHSGTFAIPDTDLSSFIGALASAQDSGAKHYFHEIASNNSPIFFDVDLNPVMSRSMWSLMISIIESAGLGEGLETSNLMICFLSMPMVTLDTIGDSLSHALSKLKPIVNGHCSWTWLDVMRACLSEDDASVNPSGLMPAVLRPVCTLFVMAIAVHVHRVVRTFFPDLGEESLRLRMLVLTNYDGISNRIHFAADADGKVKMGAHIYMRTLIVDRYAALFVWQAVVDYFVKQFPGVPGGAPVEAFWQQCFDAAPFKSTIGGLRMPYSIKAKPCPACGNTKRRKGCVTCGESGHVQQNRYYGPLAFINGDGHPDDSVLTLDRLGCRRWVMNVARVRIPAGTPVTGGFSIEGKREPQAMVHHEERRIADTLGEKKAKAIKRRFARDGVLEESPAMGHLLASVNSLGPYFDAQPKRTPDGRKMYLERADERFQATANFMPGFCAEKFHPCYRNMVVKSVALVYNKIDGEPMQLLVGFRGNCGSRCFNRRVESGDVMMAQELTERQRACRGDIAGVPGRHTNYNSCVYFIVRREGTGTVTQRCINPQVKLNRRNAQQAGAARSCKEWPGEKRDIDEKHTPTVRKMFYTEEQRADHHCQKVVMDNAQSILKRFRNRTRVEEVGPTADYAEYATRIVAEKKKRRKKSGQASPSMERVLSFDTTSSREASQHAWDSLMF